MNTYPIHATDRIFVRATLHGASVIELSISGIDSLTALIGEIRHAGRHLEGLANLFIRNLSQGWARTSFIKFYNRFPSPHTAAIRAASAYRAAQRARQSPSHPTDTPQKAPPIVNLTPPPPPLPF